MPKTEFVARAIYQHRVHANLHVMLIVRREGDAYELWDDREDSHDYIGGSEEYILDEWRNRNLYLAKENFKNYNSTGPKGWLKFIN
jgi:hypothetical protein